MFDSSQFRILVFAAALLATITYVWFAYRMSPIRRYGRVSDVIPRLLPVLITTLAGMITVIALFFSGPESRREMVLWPFTAQSRPGEDIAAKLAAIDARTDEMNRQILSLAAAPTGQSPSDAALSVIEKKVHADSERIDKFEQLFLTDAERLITVPLLQRDLQAIKDDLPTIREQVKGLSDLVTETSNQNRWVIGTLALGMLALVLPAVRSLLTTTRPDEAKTPPRPDHGMQ